MAERRLFLAPDRSSRGTASRQLGSPKQQPAAGAGQRGEEGTGGPEPRIPLNPQRGLPSHVQALPSLQLLNPSGFSS